MASRKGSLAHKSKGRERHIPSPAKFVNHDSNSDSATRHRLQFLICRLGIGEARAALVSPFIWGGVA